MITFALLYTQNRESYLRNWTAAWFLAFIGLCSFLGAGLSESFISIYMICMTFSSYFILRAAYQIFKIHMPRRWIYLALFTSAWIAASLLFDRTGLFGALVWSVYSCVAFTYYGSMFLRYGDRNIIVRFMIGVCYILWGIHSLNFPFLRTVSWFVPWGFLIGTILGLGSSVGTLCYYFEMKNRELLRIEKELIYLGFHDALTGLFNRRYFEQEVKRLEKEKHEKNDDMQIGILICDVDGLKQVNDTLGHEKGDLLLLEAARIIRDVFAEKGLAARIGGDEFAILLEEDEKGLERAYQEIRQALDLYNASDPELHLSISVGYAAVGADFDLAQAFREADNNMYREKGLLAATGKSSSAKTL